MKCAATYLKLGGDKMMTDPRLPVAAAAKLQRLKMAADDGRALVGATLKAISDAETRLAAALNTRDSASDEDRAREAQKLHDAVEAEIKSLRAVQAERQSSYEAAAAVVSRIDGWLLRLP